MTGIADSRLLACVGQGPCGIATTSWGIVALSCCFHDPSTELLSPQPDGLPPRTMHLLVSFSSFPSFLPGALAPWSPRRMPRYPMNSHSFGKALASFLPVHHPLLSTESPMCRLAKFQKFAAALLASMTNYFLCWWRFLDNLRSMASLDFPSAISFSNGNPLS